MTTLHRGVLVLGLAAATQLSCGGDDGIPNPIDASPSTACDVLAQTGCADDEKCSWVRLQTGQVAENSLGELRCVPNGDKLVNTACQWRPSGPTGWDDCERGSVCQAPPETDAAIGRCRAICGLAGDALMAPCPQYYACSSWFKLFSNEQQGETKLAGACSNKCMPVPQEIEDPLEPDRTACGSATAPQVMGCYGLPSADPMVPTYHTCSRAGGGDINCSMGNCGHGTPAGMFSNSCSAGYIGVMFNNDTTNGRLCLAYCEPAPTHNATVEPFDGVSPNTCMEKGDDDASRNCVYYHYYETRAFTIDNPATQFSDNTGLCIDRARYNVFDPDGMGPMPPGPAPTCQTLPQGDATGPVDGTEAAHWGCLPKADSPMAGMTAAPTSEHADVTFAATSGAM